ncbi:MAG: glycoside hydrolase family 92 protein, partial [Actinomyces sp.]|nr:glycoside hydrolase family 92 protein [Actinomyces sp.]
MAHEPPRRRNGRAPASRVAALSLAGALAATLAPTTVWAVPQDGDTPAFTSSFEASQTQPEVSTTFKNELDNVTGQSARDGSLLSLVAQATSSKENPPNEVASALADGLPATKWLAFENTGWAQYRLSEPAPITGYVLTSANDAPTRDPRDFTLEGSNDGESWTTLDTQTAQSWAANGKDHRLESREYTLPGRTAAFSNYRLNITANNGASKILQLADWDLLDSERTSAPSPMTTVVDRGPTSSETAKTGVGFTGLSALHYAGRQIAAGAASATNSLFSTDVTVTKGMELSYKVFPVLDADITYSATHVAVDLATSDGERLSTSGATDAYGFPADAARQGSSDILWPDQWNSVTVDLDNFVGKKITDVLLQYSNPDGDAGTAFTGWIDDITLAAAPERDTSEGLVSYVDTRRGTNSTGGYSRGNNLPATSWPNGFNFITPMTNADTYGTVYHYQRANDAQNLPGLTGIGFSHQPSIWMGDRNQLAILPAAGNQPSSSLGDRRLAFHHDKEVARPDVYSVDFDNGMKTAVTATDHGAIYQFTFTGETGSVLVDQVLDGSMLSVSADGTVTGWVDSGSGYPGRTRMFIHGVFDSTPTAFGKAPRGDRASAQYAAFDTSSDKTVELRIASSFISADQAKKNYSMELDGVGFDDARKAARDAWNARLGVITDVKGATDNQLETLYSSLYRLNLYPNSQFENVGTTGAPVYKYASPVSATSGSATDTTTNAPVKDGKIYVNNGFWDTYRTAWPAIAMLYPDLSEELVDGFVQQYRDGGWIARWSSPGYADLMTGTSSDVSFAEAYAAGTLTNSTALDAYDAA